MAKQWVVNVANGPRMIGGMLLSPGEGTFVDDGPDGAAAPASESTVVVLASTRLASMAAAGNAVPSGVLLKDPATGKIYGQSDGLGGYEPLGGASTDVILNKRGTLAESITVGADTLGLDSVLGGGYKNASTVGTSYMTLDSFVIPAGAIKPGDMIRIMDKWNYSSSTNNKKTGYRMNAGTIFGEQSHSVLGNMEDHKQGDLLFTSNTTAIWYPTTNNSNLNGVAALGEAVTGFDLTVAITFDFRAQALVGPDTVTLVHHRSLLMRS